MLCKIMLHEIKILYIKKKKLKKFNHLNRISKAIICLVFSIQKLSQVKAFRITL